ncbi:unnamed protein product [Blepharisma stoltei]|uniref:Uncharacterized protein n=1 Tax=Blepharisma stoltei TaxID=1481888 RepID=A0AAU9IJM0_9CILI|nr:unnamed protein product [Blepharisma stoltei]
MMHESLPRTLPTKRGRGRPTKADQIAIQGAAPSRPDCALPAQNLHPPEFPNNMLNNKVVESFKHYLTEHDKKYTFTSKKLAVLPLFVDQSSCAHFFFTYTSKEKSNSAIFLTFTENVAYVSILSKEFKFDKDDVKLINLINQMNAEDFRFSAHIAPIIKSSTLNEETKEEIKKPVTKISKDANTHNLVFIQRIFYKNSNINAGVWWSFIIEIIKKYQNFLNVYSRNNEFDSKGQCQKKRKINSPSYIIHKNASELNDIVISAIKKLGFANIKQSVSNETYIDLIAITYENDQLDKKLSTFPVVFESKNNFIALKLIVAVNSKVAKFEIGSYSKISHFLNLANSQCEYGFFNLDMNKSQVYFKVSHYFEGIENKSIEKYPQEMISMAIFYYKIFSFGIFKLYEEHSNYEIEGVEKLFKFCQSKIQNSKVEPFHLDTNSIDSKGKNANPIEESFEVSDPKSYEIIEKLKNNAFLSQAFETQSISIIKEKQNFRIRQVLPPSKKFINYLLEGKSSYINQIELLYLELSRAGLSISDLPIDNFYFRENQLKVKFNQNLNFNFSCNFANEKELLVKLHRDIRRYIFTHINSSKKYSNYREFNHHNNFEPDAMDIDGESKYTSYLEKFLCNGIKNSKIHYDNIPIDGKTQDSILNLWKYNSILSSDSICRFYGTIDNGDSVSLVYESYKTNALDYFSKYNLQNKKLSKDAAQTYLRELIKALLLIKSKKIPIFAFDPEMVMLPGDEKVKLRLKAENLIGEEWKSDHLKQEAFDEAGLNFSLGLFVQYMIHGNPAIIDRTRWCELQTLGDALKIVSNYMLRA